jgi:hypothetical protein
VSGCQEMCLRNFSEYNWMYGFQMSPKRGF